MEEGGGMWRVEGGETAWSPTADDGEEVEGSVEDSLTKLRGPW